MICLALTGNTRQEWSHSLSANRRWIDLVELRIDMLAPAERAAEDLAAWWKDQGVSGVLPCILTVRRTQDMGRWEGDEAQRFRLLKRLVRVLRPDYIDIELDRIGLADWDGLTAGVFGQGGTVIRSYHDGRGTPDDLSAITARLASNPHEIPKLAVMAQSELDTIRLVNSVREFGKLMPHRKGIWVAMGEYGLPTRVWPARTGSLLTYASDPAFAPAAPGHLEPRLLREVYRVGTARPTWPAYAILGSPVAHSRSPEYHNALMAREGIEGVYLPVRLDSFETFPQVAEAYGLRGASVTVPHKEAALEFVENSNAAGITPAARDCGAANTLWLGPEGSGTEGSGSEGWHADNTDVRAFRESLEEAIRVKLGKSLSDVQFLVIGAGGAARAVLAALSGENAPLQSKNVQLANRTRLRAEVLADEFGIPKDKVYSLYQLDVIPSGSLDVIIQTTSVGMEHGAAGDPSEGYQFDGTELAYDLVYTPPETAFLRRAREAGCPTVNGEAMFEGQAALQSELFMKTVNRSGL